MDLSFPHVAQTDRRDVEVVADKTPTPFQVLQSVCAWLAAAYGRMCFTALTPNDAPTSKLLEASIGRRGAACDNALGRHERTFPGSKACQIMSTKRDAHQSLTERR